MAWQQKKKRVHFHPTLYESSLWLVVHDPQTQIEEPLRAHLRAAFTVDGSEAALAAALVPHARQLDALEDETYEQHLSHLLAAIMQEAEATLCVLTEEERREVGWWQARYWQEALRRDLLTEEEMERALSHFQAWGYQEARAEVERLLKSRNVRLRSRALALLVWQWGVDAYRSTVLQFVFDDDPHCRKQGLLCLKPTAQRKERDVQAQ